MFHLPEARIKWKMDGNKQEAALVQAPLTAKRSTLSLILFWHKTRTVCAADCYRSPYRTRRRKYTSSVVIDESVIQGIKDAALLHRCTTRLT